ncbi:MAG TPA: energy transducer TonB [Pyrinomonadaceae bacterium]
MKEKRTPYAAALINSLILVFALMATASAQSVVQSSAPAPDAGQQRLKRARVLVAAHQLEAATTELNAIRNTTTDDAVRDVARIMLMSIFLEEADYMRAQSLLDETYKLRKAGDENSTRTYFALAGQVVNGSRGHLNRYRSFGIDIADKQLPAEAVSDLDHIRMLLERVAEQAREMSGQDGKSFDALGLLEEAATLRVTLARNKQERTQWQRECADVRQKLAASETRIASALGMPARIGSAPNAATPSAASKSSSPNHTSNTGPRKSTENSTTAPATQGNASNDGQLVKAAADGKPADVGSVIDRATQRVNPSYPQTAKMARITGVVTVYLEIDEKGVVTTVHRTNGPQLLKQAAEEAARRWKFRPTLINGQPVRVLGFINFNFTL